MGQLTNLCSKLNELATRPELIRGVPGLQKSGKSKYLITWCWGYSDKIPELPWPLECPVCKCRPQIRASPRWHLGMLWPCSWHDTSRTQQTQSITQTITSNQTTNTNGNTNTNNLKNTTHLIKQNKTKQIVETKQKTFLAKVRSLKKNKRRRPKVNS